MTWMKKLFGREEPAGGNGPQAAPGAMGFEDVERVNLSQAVTRETQRHLRAAGQTGNEGLVVWSGVQDGTTFNIRTVTAPRQRGIQSEDGVCVIVDGDVLHGLNVATFKRGERLFAQVHSHPGRAYHSPMDDQYAIITAPGGLSLVVPDFAVRPFAVADCAVYRLARSGKWTEVSSRLAALLIRIAKDPSP